MKSLTSHLATGKRSRKPSKKVWQNTKARKIKEGSSEDLEKKSTEREEVGLDNTSTTLLDFTPQPDTVPQESGPIMAARKRRTRKHDPKTLLLRSIDSFCLSHQKQFAALVQAIDGNENDIEHIISDFNNTTREGDTIRKHLTNPRWGRHRASRDDRGRCYGILISKGAETRPPELSYLDNPSGPTLLACFRHLS